MLSRTRRNPVGTSGRAFTRLGAVVAAAVVTGTMVAPGAASAATTGCGSSCDGKDPQTYVAVVGQAGYCYQDGRTVATSTDVELRYSPWCRTAWARWTGGGGYLTGVLIRSYAADGSLRKTYYDNGTSGDWSFMVNDKGMTAQACWYYYDDETMTTRHVRNCTAKY